MSTIIVRTDEGLPKYYCPKIGRDFGSGGNAWTSEKTAALRFDRPVDAEEFAITFIPQQAPFCKYLPFTDPD